MLYLVLSLLLHIGNFLAQCFHVIIANLGSSNEFLQNFLISLLIVPHLLQHLVISLLHSEPFASSCKCALTRPSLCCLLKSPLCLLFLALLLLLSKKFPSLVRAQLGIYGLDILVRASCYLRVIVCKYAHGVC